MRRRVRVARRRVLGAPTCEMQIANEQYELAQSAREVADLLKTGLKPEFDDVQGLMEHGTEIGYKYLDDSDREAIAEYVLGLPPIDNLIEPDTAAPATLPD